MTRNSVSLGATATTKQADSSFYQTSCPGYKRVTPTLLQLFMFTLHVCTNNGTVFH